LRAVRPCGAVSALLDKRPPPRRPHREAPAHPSHGARDTPARSAKPTPPSAP